MRTLGTLLSTVTVAAALLSAAGPADAATANVTVTFGQTVRPVPPETFGIDISGYGYGNYITNDEPGGHRDREQGHDEPAGRHRGRRRHHGHRLPESGTTASYATPTSLGSLPVQSGQISVTLPGPSVMQLAIG